MTTYGALERTPAWLRWIGGRPCLVTSLGRVRRKTGWGFYNLMSVRFTDNGEYLSMGAAEFSRWSTRLDREDRSRK